MRRGLVAGGGDLAVERAIGEGQARQVRRRVSWRRAARDYEGVVACPQPDDAVGDRAGRHQSFTGDCEGGDLIGQSGNCAPRRDRLRERYWCQMGAERFCGERKIDQRAGEVDHGAHFVPQARVEPERLSCPHARGRTFRVEQLRECVAPGDLGGRGLEVHTGSPYQRRALRFVMRSRSSAGMSANNASTTSCECGHVVSVWG